MQQRLVKNTWCEKKNCATNQRVAGNRCMQCEYRGARVASFRSLFTPIPQRPRGEKVKNVYVVLGCRLSGVIVQPLFAFQVGWTPVFETGTPTGTILGGNN